MKYIKTISIIFLIFGMVLLFANTDIKRKTSYLITSYVNPIDTPPRYKHIGKTEVINPKLSIKDTLNTIYHFAGMDSVFSFLGNRINAKPFSVDEYIKNIDKILKENEKYHKSKALIEQEMTNNVYFFPSIRYNLPLERKHVGNIKDTFFLNILERIYQDTNKYKSNLLIDSLYNILFTDEYFDIGFERFNTKAFSKLRTLIYTSARFGYLDLLDKYVSDLEYEITQYDALTQEYIFTFIGKAYASIEYHISDFAWAWDNNESEDTKRNNFEKLKFRKSCEYFLKARKLGGIENSYLNNLIFDYNNNFYPNKKLSSKGIEYTFYTKDFLKYYIREPNNYLLYDHLLQLAEYNETNTYEYIFALAFFNKKNAELCNSLYNKLSEKIIESGAVYKKNISFSSLQNPINNLEIDSALKLFNYFKNCPHDYLQLNSYISMAYCYQKHNKYKKAITLLKEARNIAIAKNNTDFINRINTLIKDFSFGKNNIRYGLYVHNNYYNDSKINNLELLSEFANAEIDANKYFAEREIASKNSEMVAKTRKIRELQSDKQQLVADLERLQSEKKRVENALISSTQNLNTLSKKIQEKEREIKSINTQLEDAKDSLDYEKRLLDSTRNQNIKLKADKDTIELEKTQAIQDKENAKSWMWGSVAIGVIFLLITFFLSVKYKKLRTSNKELITSNEKLSIENKELITSNEKLSIENKDLEIRKTILSKEILILEGDKNLLDLKAKAEEAKAKQWQELGHSMKTIIQSINLEKKAEAAIFINDLFGILIKDLVPIKEEISIINKYFNLHDLNVNFPELENVKDIKIPPCILFPLAVNFHSYGQIEQIIETEKKAEFKISKLSDYGKFITLQVSNNGSTTEIERQTSTGHKSIIDRLNYFNEEECEFEKIIIPNEAYNITFKIKKI